MSASWIYFFIFMVFNVCSGCIPTPQHDDILIPPHSFACEDSAGAIIESAVQLIDSGWGMAESQVCQLCPPGAKQLNFDSSANAIPDQISKKAAGTIDFTICSSPCVCGFGVETCYQPGPGVFPDMTLYPFCDASGCFLTVVLTTSGQLFNVAHPLIPAMYTYVNQRDAAGNLKPVTDENAFLRVQSVGCGPDCVEALQCPL